MRGLDHLAARLADLPLLRRVQLATAGFGLLMLCGVPTQFGPGVSAAERMTSWVACAAIAGVLLLTFGLRRVTWAELGTPPLYVLLGVGMTDPLAIMGPMMGMIIALSVYGRARTAVLRAASYGAALIAVSQLSPFAVHGGDNPQRRSMFAVMGLLVLFAMLMRVLKLALEGQAENSAREALMASTSTRLLGCTDLDEIRSIVDASAARLCELTPGLVLLPTERQGRYRRVLLALGATGDGVDLAGTVLPATEEIDVALLSTLVPGTRSWQALAYRGGSDPDVDIRLLVGMHRSIPQPVLDTLAGIGAQMAMATATCRMVTELAHQAHHDGLTEMPNRKVFLSRLARSVEAVGESRSCAAMIIDLDDFKLVNDTLGHAAGDGLLVEIATRMIDEVGALGLAARFGGDEFAVQLPDLDDYGTALDLARRLRTRLLEPVDLPEGTVSVGCSIGVARSWPGCEAGELMRNADIAMYAAKAGGKNRVEDFSESRHGGIARDRRTQERADGRVGERV